MRIGIDIVQISRLREVNVSHFLSELLNAKISDEPREVAKLIAVNEAVFKSLSERVQNRFRGVVLSNLYWGEVSFVDGHHKIKGPLFTKIQVAVSYTDDFVIAIAVSRVGILSAFRCLKHFR